MLAGDLDEAGLRVDQERGGSSLAKWEVFQDVSIEEFVLASVANTPTLKEYLILI